jgi:hypothetical protein
VIKLLSGVGRAVIVVAAALTIIGFTVAGYNVGRPNEFIAYGSYRQSGGAITLLELVFSVLGCGIGIIVAGAVFGAIATLYEIRDSLRLLAGPNRDNSRRDETAERRLATPIRREPRIG